jgi:hypothetical protein
MRILSWASAMAKKVSEASTVRQTASGLGAWASGVPPPALCSAVA